MKTESDLYFDIDSYKSKYIMAKHNALGVRGEQLAVEFLEKNNYIILERNWRCGKSEIDIIAKQAHRLIFVEVKTRSNTYFGMPETAVTSKKQTQLIKGAIEYLHKTQHDGALRFDIIGVVIKNDCTEIQHIEDAFFPGLE